MLTIDLAMVLVTSVIQTNYSVVWSLNKHNEHVLNDIKLDQNKYFISSWTPQVTLLQHKSFSMAILHGGSDGANEALYYRVPLIVIPLISDQLDWEAKVENSGVGVQLKPHRVTYQTIKITIETGKYHEKTQKMSQIMKRAGGVDKAADLVEFYTNVGYDHLTPGYNITTILMTSYATVYHIDCYVLYS